MDFENRYEREGFSKEAILGLDNIMEKAKGLGKELSNNDYESPEGIVSLFHGLKDDLVKIKDTLKHHGDMHKENAGNHKILMGLLKEFGKSAFDDYLNNRANGVPTPTVPGNITPTAPGRGSVGPNHICHECHAQPATGELTEACGCSTPICNDCAQDRGAVVPGATTPTPENNSSTPVSHEFPYADVDFHNWDEDEE